MTSVRAKIPMAVSDGVPTKRKRVVTSKPTRNGCKTCRSRRIKCDEVRPSCNKCANANRTCGGYDALPPGRTATSRPLLPASRSPSTISDDASSYTSSAQITPYGPRNASPSSPPCMLSFVINDMERSAFDFFRLRMAGPLEIMSPSGAWIKQALQLSIENKAVFHGITALSSANLAMASISHPTFAGLHRPERYTEALNQYSKTIAALQRQIRGSVDGKSPLEPVLLTCLLLMCYELHAERSSMALRHHSMGRDIVQKHLRDKGQAASDSLQQLADAFDNLGVGSNYNRHEHPFPMQTVGSAQIPMQMPHKFQLSVAWDELDHLIDAVNRLLSRLYQFAEQRVAAIYGNSLDQGTHYCLASCLTRSIKLPGHDPLLSEIAHLRESHDHWVAAFSNADTSCPKASRAMALLRIRQWTASFTLVTCRVTQETQVDAHESDFSRVLDLAQFYLETDTSRPRPRRPRSIYGNGQDDDFCLEEGTLSALYLIALKSRTSATRHRAVEILANAYRREGLGSSTVVAQMAVAIVRLEEQRARGMVADTRATHLIGSDVPEAARFTDIVRAAVPNLYRPTCRLICARYLHESNGSIELTEYLSSGPCFPYSKCAGKCLTGFNFELSKEAVQYDLMALTESCSDRSKQTQDIR